MIRSATLRPRSTMRRRLGRVTLVLAFSLFLVDAAENLQLSGAQQSGRETAKQLSRPFGVQAQLQGGIPHQLASSPSVQNRHAAKTRLAATATQTALFLDPHEPRYSTGAGPSSVAVGDFNGDGKLDLAIAYYSDNSVSVLLGNGDGTFQERLDYPTGRSLLSLAVGDFNGDGNQDLVVANTASVSVLLGNGDGTFRTQPEYPVGGNSVAVGDFNGDGKLDLAITRGSSVSVLLGNGDGTFRTQMDYATGIGTTSVAVGDFNGDGKLDLAVAAQYSDVNGGSAVASVLLGNGDGTFQAHVDYVAANSLGFPMCIVKGDFNGDGKQDLVLTGNISSVLLGNGDGTFQWPKYFSYTGEQSRVTGFNGGLTVVGDFNRDGSSDLAVSNPNFSSVTLLLGNGDGTFQAPVDYPTGEYPGSVALGDFNDDGRPDLAVTNSADSSVSVLLGNGDGTLQDQRSYYPTGANPWSEAVGDFNGDGTPDLAVANWNNSVSVLLGNGDGTFHAHVDYPTGGFPSSVAVGDFNRDGKLDLVVANWFDYTLSVLLGNGDGTFGAQAVYSTGPGPNSVVVGDFNGDGKLDLAVAGSYSGPDSYAGSVSILLGNGDGSFQPHVDYPVGDGSFAVVVGDLNADGKADLATANYSGKSISVLFGNGDGTFQPHLDYLTTDSLLSLMIADFNGDGKPDLVSVPGLNVLLNNGDGTLQGPFSYPTSWYITSVAAGDFNADEKADLAVVARDAGVNMVSIFLGNGNGTFQENTTYASGQGYGAVTVADFNRDGAPDLAFVTPGNAVSVLINRSLQGTITEVQSLTNPSILGQSVTMQAAVRSSSNSGKSTSIPTGTLSFLDGSTRLGNQTLDGNGAATFAINSLTAGSHNILASYFGDANFNPSTSTSLIQVVNPIQDFGLNGSPSSATLRAGGSAVFTVEAASMNGFGGVVSLACSVSPSRALAPICALNPASIMPSANGSATSQLTVTTTAPAAFLPASKVNQQPNYTLYVVFSSLTVLGLVLSAGQSKRRSVVLTVLFLNLFLLGLGSQIACGGGTGSQPSSSGTPPGQYTVTVNAVAGSITHAAKVTLTVQ
jgi:hypothetical protein